MERGHEASQHQGDGVSSTAATRPFSPRIDRTYPKPKLKLPPGACDTHFHFIGPQKQFPLKPNHVFSHLEFEDTPIEDWLKMQDALGLSRGLFLPREHFGRDVLVAGDPLMVSGNAATRALSNARPLAEFVADLPVTEASRRQLLALFDATRDPLAGRSIDEKLKLLKRTS